jgi:hypothetical protein
MTHMQYISARGSREREGDRDGGKFKVLLQCI